EIESFYDGVHGFGGHGNVIAPRIEPNDSFIARMTPPRAGTFIYHTHFDEARQQSGGLYGAFVVLERGRKWDPAHDRIIMLGTSRDTTNDLLIDGQFAPTMHFKAGASYRIRLINITLARPSVLVSLTDGKKLLEWNVVAQDGADLPSYQAGMRPASIQITIGQTFDMLFKAPPAGEYALEVRTGVGALVGKARLLVE
ncbi:MAG TPA: multicopper oxidase domain-containing protein, partial [Longimicrobiales bacterium]